MPSLDPFEYVRRRFAQELARQEQRLVDAVLSVPGAMVDTAGAKTAQFLDDAFKVPGPAAACCGRRDRRGVARPLCPPAHTARGATGAGSLR